MKNYYDEIIEEIEQSLQKEDYEKAKKLLETELSVPYVPEPYFSKFVGLYQSLPNLNVSGAKYFQDIDEIEKALKSEELLQMKALRSLEQLNLKLYFDDLEAILFDRSFEDWVKKQIIVLLLEQDFKNTMMLSLSNEDYQLDLSTLTHPFKTNAYTNALIELEERYGMDNPSFLQLCFAELNYQVSNEFPFKHEDIDVDGVIEKVNLYLNAN